MKRRNDEINKKLKKMFEEKGILSCEIKRKNCNKTYGLTWAHRHKRNWYLGRQELLSDFNQVALACLNCHIEIEQNKELTKEIFERLRGRDEKDNGIL